jgi:hypothetical protein
LRFRGEFQALVLFVPWCLGGEEPDHVIVLVWCHFRVSVTTSAHLPKGRNYASYEPRQDDTYLAHP